MIHHGDALTVLRTLPEASVNCCVTSPPYWGLRDYGVSGQIGLEETPSEYVETIVAIFSEVRRVLRDDGTLWLNLGDSYAGSWGSQGRQGHGEMASRSVVSARQIAASAKKEHNTGSILEPGLKPKDLVGIPWRVAFALQADGWWLRQDIIWHKPNPMPESVQDRCTKSHEYLFLLTKSKKYFYDAKAIEEPAAYLGPNGQQQSPYSQGFGRRTAEEEQERGINRRDASPMVHGNEPGRSDGGAACNKPDQLTRNKRSVWTIATQPFPEAHFATFPEDLIRPCILAGCPPGGVVLDPFAGAGTTLLVAQKLNCEAVGIDLNAEYIGIAERRLKQAVLPLSAEPQEVANG